MDDLLSAAATSRPTAAPAVRSADFDTIWKRTRGQPSGHGVTFLAATLFRQPGTGDTPQVSGKALSADLLSGVFVGPQTVRKDNALEVLVAVAQTQPTVTATTGQQLPQPSVGPVARSDNAGGKLDFTITPMRPARGVTLTAETDAVPVNANRTSDVAWKKTAAGVDQVGLPLIRDYDLAPMRSLAGWDAGSTHLEVLTV